jgi:hypothetical protein
MSNSARRFRRLPILLIAIAATAIGAIAAVTVISRQNVSVKEESSSQERKPLVARPALTQPAAAKTYVTVKVAGQDVQIDGQTGQVKELSPEEAKKLAAGLRQEINQSTEGLVEEQRPDGTVSVELNGHFQNVAVARRNDDGTVSASCVDNPRSAGEFFGIDPQLIDSKATKSTTDQQRQPARTVNTQNQ